MLLDNSPNICFASSTYAESDLQPCTSTLRLLSCPGRHGQLSIDALICAHQLGPVAGNELLCKLNLTTEIMQLLSAHNLNKYHTTGDCVLRWYSPTGSAPMGAFESGIFGRASAASVITEECKSIASVNARPRSFCLRCVGPTQEIQSALIQTIKKQKIAKDPFMNLNTYEQRLTKTNKVVTRVF